MKLIFICIFCIGLVTSTKIKNAPFSGTLFADIVDQEGAKNIIISPTSVYTSLGLAYLGADGTTAAELKNVLRLDENSTKEEVAKSYGEFFNYYDTLGDKDVFEYKNINKIFVDKKYHIEPVYNELAKKYFNLTAETVDFGNGKKAATKINKWVSKQTDNKIRNTISSNSINSSTSAILLSTAYLKGSWQQKFDTKNTEKRDFYLNEIEKKPVDMMYQEGYFFYADLDEIDATALVLPYESTDIVMFIILPNEKDGLKTVQDQLKVANISALDTDFEEENIRLYLPKFKFGYQVSLDDALSEEGLQDMFSGNADFHSLAKSGQSSLLFSQALHNAFIEVGEDGTEVGTDTGDESDAAQSEDKLEARSYFEFNVNHPFMFSIRNGDTIAFTGQVYDPNS